MLDRRVSWGGIGTAWRGVRLGASAAVGAVALFALPAAAGAEIVNPAPVNPATVTPHVVSPPATPSAPAPTSGPARGPSALAPSPTPTAPTSTPHPAGGPGRAPIATPGPGGDDDVVRERDLPGAGIIGGENDAPFPEGLPALHSSACDLDCAQEWYGYFDDRASALWVNSLSDPSLKSAADSMLAMETAAERQVEAQGGIPGEEAPTPVERPTASGTRSAPSGGSSGAQSPPSEPSTKGADDSKKDDGPPVGWALGEFDSSEIVDGLMFATGGVLVQAASEAYHGNSSSTACNKKTPEEKATAAACPK